MHGRLSDADANISFLVFDTGDALQPVVSED